MTIILAVSLLINILTITALLSMSRSHFGTLSPSATRALVAVLNLFRVPVSIVGIDIRGMNALNAAHNGYAETDILIRRFVSAVRRRGPDVFCQIYADEFIIISTPGAASKIMKRLATRAEEISATMPEPIKTELFQRTNGRVYGFHASMVAKDRATGRDVGRIMDRVESQKFDGCEIGTSRDTSGWPGTVVSEMD